LASQDPRACRGHKIIDEILRSPTRTRCRIDQRNGEQQRRRGIKFVSDSTET
jgi:hypothetical protein